jgi:hypothetical protein
MKFGFKLGKSKDKAATEEAAGDAAVAEAADIAEELIQGAGEDETTARPHAPLQELSLESEQGQETGEAPLEEEIASEEEGETVKLVEVQASPAAAIIPPPPPAPTAPAAKKDGGGKPGDPLDIGATISNIFENTDDEENPLANLIKSLPEVAATELIDDLKEINDIIKDWKKK